MGRDLGRRPLRSSGSGGWADTTRRAGEGRLPSSVELGHAGGEPTSVTQRRHASGRVARSDPRCVRTTAPAGMNLRVDTASGVPASSPLRVDARSRSWGSRSRAGGSSRSTSWPIPSACLSSTWRNSRTDEIVQPGDAETEAICPRPLQRSSTCLVHSLRSRVGSSACAA